MYQDDLTKLNYGGSDILMAKPVPGFLIMVVTLSYNTSTRTGLKKKLRRSYAIVAKFKAFWIL